MPCPVKLAIFYTPSLLLVENLDPEDIIEFLKHAKIQQLESSTLTGIPFQLNNT